MHNLVELLSNPMVLTAIVGAIVSLIIQLIKKVLALEPTTWFTRGVLAIVALASTLVMQLTGHSLIDPGLWTGIVQAAFLYAVAHITHASVLKNPQTDATST